MNTNWCCFVNYWLYFWNSPMENVSCILMLSEDEYKLHTSLWNITYTFEISHVKEEIFCVFKFFKMNANSQCFVKYDLKFWNFPYERKSFCFRTPLRNVSQLIGRGIENHRLLFNAVYVLEISHWQNRLVFSTRWNMNTSSRYSVKYNLY